MKIIRTLFCVLLFNICNISYGQSKSLDIGIEIGPNLASVRGYERLGNPSKLINGFIVGLGFQSHLTKALSLNSMIGFERKGTELSGDAYNVYGGFIGSYIVQAKYNYLYIPVLLRATFGRKLKYFINTGPFFGVLLSQEEVSNNLNVPTKYNSFNLEDSFDSGISVGLGLSFPFNKNLTASFELRNNHGIYCNSIFSISSIHTNSTDFIFGFNYRLENKLSVQK